jgi:hypothetical protein
MFFHGDGEFRRNKVCMRTMPLDSRVTLRTDAEQAKRVIFGGKKMARRRFQLGSLFQRGKHPKVWVARWWEEIINPDGSMGRRRRAEVLGTVAELCSRSRAMEVLTKRLNPINSGMHRSQSIRTFSHFVREDWLPVVLPTVKYATQKTIATSWTCIYYPHSEPTHSATSSARQSKRSWLQS